MPGGERNLVIIILWIGDRELRFTIWAAALGHQALKNQRKRYLSIWLELDTYKTMGCLNPF